MLRTIHMHGALGAHFQEKVELDISSPAEVIRALCTMLSGFQDYMSNGYYQIFRGAEIDGRDQDPQELHIAFADNEAELHIVPRAFGAKQGVGKVILGAVLIAAAFVTGGMTIAGMAVSGVLAKAGVAMMLGGISQMLAPQSAISDYESREQPKSQLFGNALNVSTPGMAVPVIVGECEVGSVVVSAAIHIEDRVG